MVMPKVTTYSANLHLKGSVNGLKVNDTVDIRLQKDIEKTFVQTDKFLYRPGEKVQFRVLTVTGNKMKVSTAEYPEAWVNTPSRTRIAQWKNVSNTDGLVHLDFQLADEPEEGYYTIFVKTPHRRISQSFKVEEFVLPRFEVTIKKPKYILGTDDKFSFTACANYTYGQPVKGNLSFTVHNNQNRKCHVSQTTNVTVSIA
ncbi:Pregnancy zone protein [Chionoecetes opilio]|uniref:TEP1-F n=1 Tax=Chionoecetes opilio TaxID=41210 RepID=A0A8J4YGD2_CHIOP|nr:Pregnancy zone protein [Chionoecetes opilio]